MCLEHWERAISDHRQTGKRSSKPGSPRSLGRRDRITLQEIQDVLADQGYSADKRKAWLKEVLTDLEQEHSKTPSADRKQLIDSIKAIVGKLQKTGRPISNDVL